MSGGLLAIGECMVELADAGGGLLRKGFAGDTFNTAWYARRRLPSRVRVSYLSAVGDDALSAEMLGFMAQAGIDIQFMRKMPGKSPGLYLISLSNGERSFSYWRGESAARQLATDRANVRKACSAADMIYLSGITLGILPPDEATFLLDELKLCGKAVAFDPNYRARLWAGRADCAALMQRAAEIASLVLTGVDDERDMAGRSDVAAIVQHYQTLGRNTIVAKNGGRGASVFADGVLTNVPAVAGVQVVDSTAAGDSFNGAFLAALMQGDNAVAAAHEGARVAAQVLAARGALVMFD